MTGLARIAVLLALAVPCCAAPAALAQKAKPPPKAGFDQQILYHSVEFEAGESQHFDVTCPKGWEADAGGLESNPADVAVDRSWEVDYQNGLPIDRWEFWARNVTSRKVVATFWLACIRAKPKAPLNKKRYSVVLSQEPQTVKPYTLKCPKKWKAGGVSVAVDDKPKKAVHASGADQGLAIVGLKPLADGHEVTVASGTDPVSGQIMENCFPPTLKTSKGRRRVEITRHGVTVTAPPGLSRVGSSCGAGRFQLGTPGFTAPQPLQVAPSIAADGAAQLRVSNPTPSPVQLKLLTSCVPGKSRGTPPPGTQVDTTVGPPVITVGKLLGP
jgi:hypothetical protein